MKKLNFGKWQTVPLSLVFPDENVTLNITWPEFKSGKYIDSLTGLTNRRGFDEAAQLIIEEANRQGASFGLLLFDIDHFKHFNDTYGHQAGDEVLKNFSAVAASVLRQEDLLCRIGGEEFAILTPAHSKTFEIGERIRTTIRIKKFDARGVKVNITCSFGCAIYPDVTINFDKLFEKADEALYKAKESRDKGVKAG